MGSCGSCIKNSKVAQGQSPRPAHSKTSSRSYDIVLSRDFSQYAASQEKLNDMRQDNSLNNMMDQQLGIVNEVSMCKKEVSGEINLNPPPPRANSLALNQAIEVVDIERSESVFNLESENKNIVAFIK